MAIQNSRILSEKELLALKKKIEEGKAKIAEAKGKKNYLMSELATKWGCKTIEEAEKKLLKCQKELDTLSVKLDSLLEEIANKYADDTE